MTYDDFITLLNKLTKPHRDIVLDVLRKMEHENDPNFKAVNFEKSFTLARLFKNMTLKDICIRIAERNNVNPEQAVQQYKNSIVSAMKRTGCNSIYYKDLLDVLEIDETVLEDYSDYYREKFYNDNCTEWLYNSVSDRNKLVAFYLAQDL
ncbi:MAG: hypothetical protein ACI4XI_08495, partial [Ruminococcus sp.]